MAPKLTKTGLKNLSDQELDFLFNEMKTPGFIDRALSNLAPTQRGQADILRSRGYNVVPSQQGLQVKTSQGNLPVDPKGFDLGDIADFSGDVLEGAVGAGGAALGGAGAALGTGGFGTSVGVAAGSAAGSAAGDYLRQSAAQMAGSKQPIDVKRIQQSGVLGGTADLIFGEGGGKALLRAVAPFAKRFESTPILRDVVKPFKKLDDQFGGQVSQNLPASSVNESKFVAGLTNQARTNPATASKFEQNVAKPFIESQQELLGNIAQSGGIPKAAGRDVAGKATEAAVKATDLARKGQIDQAYQAFRQLVGPNQPAAATKTLARAEELLQRAKSENREDVVNLLDDWADRISDVSTVDQMDGLRKDLFAATKAEKFGTNARGLDAELNSLHGAVKDDILDFFERGGRPDDAALNVATAAARAGEKQATDTMTLSKVLDEIGGLDISGMTSGEIPTKVRGRIRRINNKGVAPGKPDIVAQQLGEQYPEFGITDLRTLKERLSKDATFFGEVERASELGADRAFASRAGEIAIDTDAIERKILQTESLDDLIKLASDNENAVQNGLVSRFEADRLNNQVQQRMLNLSGGASEGEREALESAARQMDERFGRLGQELKEKGLRARGLAREKFALEETSAAQILGDVDRLENVAQRLLSGDFTTEQVKSFKARIGAAEGGAGLKATAEGQKAWQALQGEIFDTIRSKSLAKDSDVGGLQALSGARMLSELGRIDRNINTSKAKLKAIFGDDTADALVDMANALEAASVSERRFGNPSGTAQAMQFQNDISNVAGGAVGALKGNPLGLLSALGGVAGKIGAAGLVSGPAEGAARRFVTSGVLQKPGQQALLQSIGRIGGRAGTRTALQDFRDR